VATLKPSGRAALRVLQPAFSPFPVTAEPLGKHSPTPPRQPGLQLALQHGHMGTHTLQPAARPRLSGRRRLLPASQPAPNITLPKQ